MIERLINNLPRVFVTAGIIGPLLFFIISGYTLDTEWNPYFVASAYIPYAIASTIIFVGNLLFIRRDLHNQRLPTVWLVALTYATGFFALLFWGATLLVLINNFYLHSEGSFFARRLGFALIGSGLAGDGIAAIVLIIGLKKHLLGRRIHPWIWRKRS